MARAAPERPATGLGPSMDTVIQPGNLKRALARVRRNQGAPGLDGMTVEELGIHLKDHWPETRSRLLGDTYEPQPVRRVRIPKASGGVRLLGVPKDLQAQQDHLHGRPVKERSPRPTLAHKGSGGGSLIGHPTSADRFLPTGTLTHETRWKTW